MYVYFVLLSAAIIIETTISLHTVCDCKDYYGSCRTENQEWVEDNTWKYHCVSSKTEFIGCLGPERAQRKIVLANSQITVQGFWFKCEQTEKKLRFEQEPFCNVSGKLMHVGETYRENVFQKTCEPWGIGISGCYYKNKNKQESFMKVGETVTTGSVIHNCQLFTIRPGRVQYYTTPKTAQLTDSPKNKNQTTNKLENFLPFSPQPWLHQYATEYIQMDGTFAAKVRFID